MPEKSIIDAEFKIIDGEGSSFGQKNMSPEQQKQTEKPKENNWLYGEKEDLNAIKSEALRGIVGQLGKTPDFLLKTTRLEEQFYKIQDLVAEGKAKEDETIFYLGKITEKLKERHLKEETERRAKEQKEEEHRQEVFAEQKRAADEAQKTRESQERTEEMAKETKRQKEEEEKRRQQALLHEKKQKEKLEYKLLPEDEKDQIAFVREMLEVIESTDKVIISTESSMSYGDSQTYGQRIMSWVKEGRIKNEDLAREAKARIRLQHCSAIMSAIQGNVDKASDYLGGVFKEEEPKSYALQGSDFEFLFSRQKESFTGLKIIDAWNILQKAATQKIGTIRYLGDNMTEQKQQTLINSIYLEIENKLPANLDPLEKRKVAVRSLKIAERIAKATREVSVWNVDLVGRDPLAEAIYLYSHRIDKQNQDKGIINTIKTIRGFGTSFFRQVRSVEKVGNDKRFISETAFEISRVKFLPPRERIALWFKHNRAPEKDPFNKDPEKQDFTPNISDLVILSPESFNFSVIGKDAYQSYLSYVGKALKAKEFIKQAKWVPADLEPDKIEKIFEVFNAVDPENIYGIRAELVLGILLLIYHGDESFSLMQMWELQLLKNLRDNLTNPRNTIKGITEPFISPETWKNIVAILKNTYRVDIYNRARVGQALIPLQGIQKVK